MSDIIHSSQSFDLHPPEGHVYVVHDAKISMHALLVRRLVPDRSHGERRYKCNIKTESFNFENKTWKFEFDFRALSVCYTFQRQCIWQNMALFIIPSRLHHPQHWIAITKTDLNNWRFTVYLCELSETLCFWNQLPRNRRLCTLTPVWSCIQTSVMSASIYEWNTEKNVLSFKLFIDISLLGASIVQALKTLTPLLV